MTPKTALAVLVAALALAVPAASRLQPDDGPLPCTSCHGQVTP